MISIIVAHLRYVGICNFEGLKYLRLPEDRYNNLRLSISAENLSFSYYLLLGGLYPVRPWCAARSEGPGVVGVPEDLQPIIVVE